MELAALVVLEEQEVQVALVALAQQVGQEALVGQGPLGVQVELEVLAALVELVGLGVLVELVVQEVICCQGFYV